jgi:hypothetical protein
MQDIFGYCLFFALLLVFLLTAGVTLAGITGKLLVPDVYLKLLVTALLVEVASAIVYEFKKMDFSPTGQRLIAELDSLKSPPDLQQEKGADPFQKLHLLVQDAEMGASLATELGAVNMTLKEVGSDPTPHDKLRRLISAYRRQGATRLQLAQVQQQLGAMQEETNRLSTVFPDLKQVTDIPTAVEALFRDGSHIALVETALEPHRFFNVTKPEFVPKAIEPLEPSDPVSRALLVLAQQRKGPFLPVGEEVYVSIPHNPGFTGDRAAVRSGSKFENARITLTDPRSGNSIEVQGTSIHTVPPEKDPQTGKEHELIQLTEETASKLFETPRFIDPKKVAEAKPEY